MPWRHNINCCRFRRLFLRKAVWILCSWLEIYQMMTSHMKHVSTHLAVLLGVLKHVEIFFRVAFGILMMHVATLFVPPFGVLMHAHPVSLDTWRSDSSCSSIWSITSSEGDFDTEWFCVWGEEWRRVWCQQHRIVVQFANIKTKTKEKWNKGKSIINGITLIIFQKWNITICYHAQLQFRISTQTTMIS